MTPAVAVSSERTPAQRVARRLLPLQVGAGLQAFLLWAPVEKLFMTEIGFTAASIGVMAAVYAAVVPLLEVPSGILADRSSRRWLLALASVAMAASSLIGAMSHGVLTYMVAAMFLGVAIALNSGTADSIIYDTVLEETGSGKSFETRIGRLRAVESGSLVVSAIFGGLLAGWASTRLTYWITVPIALLSGAAFLLLREPRLHRQGEPTGLRQHIGLTFTMMTRSAAARRALLLVAVTGVVSHWCSSSERCGWSLSTRRRPSTARTGRFWSVPSASVATWSPNCSCGDVRPGRCSPASWYWPLCR